MNRKLPRILALALALLLLTGLVASVSAATTSDANQTLLQKGVRQGRQHFQTAIKAISDLTGLSITDIHSQRAEGKSLAAIAESKGISEQSIIDQVVAERQAVLDKLKADNKITEEQYQSCLANMETKIKTNMERTTIGSPDGKQGPCLRANQGQRPAKGFGWDKGMGRGWQKNCANCPNFSPKSN